MPEPRNKKPRITRICPCGAEFSFSEKELKWRNPTYCSLKCRHRYFSGNGKKAKYIITPEMENEIRRVYREEVGMEPCCKGNDPVRRLAERLDLPRWKVTRTAIRLGLIATQKKELNWSPEELKILESHAHKCPEVIQQHLKKAGYKRSVTGIILKRKRLRLLQNLKGQSATSLAECFGVDMKTVQRWIRQGLIKTNKRELNRTKQQGGNAYYIKDRWVRDFIVKYPELIDLRKVEKHWFIDILGTLND